MKMGLFCVLAFATASFQVPFSKLISWAWVVGIMRKREKDIRIAFI
jgi:hypothetical protein